MSFVDHLKGQRGQDLVKEVAFGRNVVAGDLCKSIVTGTSPSHVVTVQHMLGDALGKGWAGPEGVWFRGELRPAAKYKFYPGIMSPGNGDSVQGIDSVFSSDTPHSNTAWIRAECPSGSEVKIPDANTSDVPPEGLSGIYRCQLGDIYDEDGDIVDTDILITNPADVLAFGCVEIRKFPIDRVDWPSIVALRDICDALITPDYTTLPQGVGLTARYYDGSAFDTLKSRRVDPVIHYLPSTGAPALDISPTSFSVRFEGKIRFKHTETVTLYLTHNGGGRLWIDNLTTPLIDQWGTTGEHSTTFAATADQYYDIKMEWNNAAGDSEFKLEWQSTSQPRQVVTQDRLYPKNEEKKRFECHIAFTQRTTFDEFLRAVLFTCNGSFQDVDGKLQFFCVDELASSFEFNDSNVVNNSVQYSSRFSQLEVMNLPNRYIAEGRDLDSRFLEKFDPPLELDLPDLQSEAGRIIEETVVVGNTTRVQALENLAYYAKLRTAPMVAEFQGMPQTFPVLAGDVVTFNNSVAGWVDKQFLCIEATDRSVDRGPDKRTIKLLDWPE